jgi:hypothetical protein
MRYARSTAASPNPCSRAAAALMLCGGWRPSYSPSAVGRKSLSAGTCQRSTSRLYNVVSAETSGRFRCGATMAADVQTMHTCATCGRAEKEEGVWCGRGRRRLVLICLRSDRVLFCPVCFRGMSKMRDDPPNYVFQVLRTGTPNKHPNLPTCRKPGGKSRWGCSMHSNTCSSLQAPPPPRLPKGVQAMTVCLTEVIPLTDVFSPTSVVVTEIPFACDTYIRLSFEDPI